jgi:hypothetical protein
MKLEIITYSTKFYQKGCRGGQYLSKYLLILDEGQEFFDEYKAEFPSSILY